MANASSGGEQAGASGRVKLPIPLLLLVVVLGVWIGIAGGGAAAYFLVRSGKLPLPHGSSTGATPATATRSLVLEPILVNLADESGHAYLRIGLTLELNEEAHTSAPEPEGGKAKGGPDSAVRDIVLTVLGRQSSTFLLGPDGKEHLKIELKEAIQKSNLKITVNDLYFSDFLVQV